MNYDNNERAVIESERAAAAPLKWTKEQKEAIYGTGNLIVSAGAGSGKTTVMIARICELIKSGADLSDMMVCTFTKAAAADMKRKLGESLAAMEGEHALKQLKKLPGAEISTLHSWCSRIIKAWFFLIDANPEFVVMEEGEDTALKTACAEEVITANVQNGEQTFVELYEAFKKNRSHAKLREILLTVYDYARAQPDFKKWLNSSAVYDDDNYRKALINELYLDSRALLTSINNLKIACAQANFVNDYNALCEFYAYVKDFKPYNDSVPRFNGKNVLFCDLHEKFKDLKNKYSGIIKARDEIVQMPSYISSIKYCKELARLAFELDSVYSASKAASGKVDYSDLEHFTLEILKADKKEEVIKNCKYLFVDEYQDINPLQNKILSYFKCQTFFVGDVKQSIYGFRMCSPQFFARKRDKYEKDNSLGHTVSLKTNYRSDSKIINTVNKVFSNVMTRNFGGVNYSREMMECPAPNQNGIVRAYTVPRHKIEMYELADVYSVKYDCNIASAPDIEDEADAVLNEIREILEGDVTVNGVTRKAEYSDIAVLTRSRGEFLDILERKLRENAIPVTTVSSDTSASSFKSVAALISMLKLLNNAADDVNLASVMLSPALGGFSVEELAQIKSGKKGRFCELVYSYSGNSELAKKTADFVSDIEYLRKEAACRNVAELAGIITAKYGCFNAALYLGGEREAAALDCYLEHLLNQTERGGLNEYLRYLENCGTPHLNVTDSGNTVKLMTIHNSKGLEFPCVILPELNKKFNFSDIHSSVICDKSEGIVLRNFDFKERKIYVNPRYAVCSSKLKRSLVAEELRILYVAMTRAKCRLSLFARKPGKAEKLTPDKADCYYDWLYNVMNGSEAYTFSADKQNDEKPVARKACVEIVDKLKERFELLKRTPGAGGAVKKTVTEVASALSEETAHTPAIFSDDRAAERGTAYHKFMQYAEFGKEGEYERLARLFPQEAALVDKAEIERAFKKIGDYIAGRKFVREKAFVYNAPAHLAGEEDNPVLVQGVIDLMIFDSDGVEIIDYKTGLEQNLRSEHYARQLQLYKCAAESIFASEKIDLKVKNAVLFSFSSGNFVKTP